MAYSLQIIESCHSGLSDKSAGCVLIGMKRTEKDERTSEKRGIAERLIREPRAPITWTEEEAEHWYQTSLDPWTPDDE
jgi:hypothetical protein